MWIGLRLNVLHICPVIKFSRNPVKFVLDPDSDSVCEARIAGCRLYGIQADSPVDTCVTSY